MFSALRKVLLSTRLSPIFIVLLLLSGVFYVYIWRLGSLTPGLSPAESEAIKNSSSLQEIKDNPIYAPHKLLQYGFQDLGHSDAFWMRLASVILALIFLYIFFSLLRQWFGKLVGILGSLLFVGTPWMIILARNATPDIMLISPVAILASYVWLARTEKHKDLAWFFLTISIGISIYSPGLIWLVLATLLIANKKIARAIQLISPVVLTLSFLLLLLMLAPLGLALVNNIDIAKDLILWPSSWSGVLETAKSVLWAASSLIWKAPANNDLIIGRLPLLSSIQIVLMIFGLYVLWSRARSQLYILLTAVILGVVAAGVNKNAIFLTIALPAVGIFAAAGLRYLYGEWRTIFPRNPLPRGLAIALMVSVVILNLLIGIRYSLVAWPRAVDTRNTYMLQ